MMNDAFAIMNTIIKMNLSHFLIAFESADIPDKVLEFPLLSHEMQETLMDKFTAKLDPYFLQTIRGKRNRPWKCGCDWIQSGFVGCSGFEISVNEGVITKINIWENERMGDVTLHFAPSTVRDLYIVACSQSFTLNTRGLSREAEFVSLERNKISGRLNLQTLPHGLALLNLPANRLTGPISFIGLPPKMRSLYLQRNRITQHTVYYADVPGDLTIKLKKNHVSAVKPLFAESCEAELDVSMK